MLRMFQQKSHQVTGDCRHYPLLPSVNCGLRLVRWYVILIWLMESDSAPKFPCALRRSLLLLLLLQVLPGLIEGKNQEGKEDWRRWWIGGGGML